MNGKQFERMRTLPSPSRQILGLAVAVIVCYGAALLGNLATMPQIPTWYANIEKPTWTRAGLVATLCDDGRRGLADLAKGRMEGRGKNR